MLKRFFQGSASGSEPQAEEVHSNGTSPVAAPATPAVQRDHAPVARTGAAAPVDPFDYVYQAAAIQPPVRSFGIRKVAEMVFSPYLSGMSPDLKRNSLQMALEAAGADIDFLLEDAVLRQRALNDYEETLQKKLREFEVLKSEEARAIQAELDHLTAECMARIQANLDEVAREQDTFRGWQRRKTLETQRIADAAMYCVPNVGRAGTEGFQTLLERGAAAGWR